MLEQLPPKTRIVPSQHGVEIRSKFEALRQDCKVFHITGQQLHELQFPSEDSMPKEGGEPIELNFDDSFNDNYKRENIVVPFPVFALKADPMLYYGRNQILEESTIVHITSTTEGSGTKWIVLDTRAEVWLVYELIVEQYADVVHVLNVGQINADGSNGGETDAEEAYTRGLQAYGRRAAGVDRMDIIKAGVASIQAHMDEIVTTRILMRDTYNGPTINSIIGTRLNFRRLANFCHLLSARGITTETIPDPNTPMNRQQRKMLNWKPVEHYIIKMRNPKRSWVDHIARAQRYVAQRREHWVRAHVKHYKDGREVYVSAHKRCKDQGPAAKVDYDARSFIQEKKKMIVEL
jgi:hypothetical protein